MKSRCWLFATWFILLALCGRASAAPLAGGVAVDQPQVRSGKTTSENARLRDELQVLSKRVRKTGNDLEAECTFAATAESLNYGSDWQDKLVAAAALDARLDSSIFRKRYPTLWKSLGIVAIDDFDGFGQKTVLVRRFGMATTKLTLSMLNPRAFPKD